MVALATRAAAALVVALIVAGTVAGRALRGREPSVCSGAPLRLVGVWDEAAAREVTAALQRAAGGRGAETTALVRTALDRYAEGWSVMYRDACEATHVRKEQTNEQLVLRMDCLEDRRRDLRAIAGAISAPEGPAPASALEATSRLPPLARCADLAALQAPTQLPPDPALRGSVDAVRETLAKGRSELAVGRYGAALETATDAVAGARRTGFEPITVEALGLRARVLHASGQTGAAEAGLVEALEGALRVRHDRVAVEALSDLAWVVGYDGGRPDEGLRFARLARAMLPRMRERDDLDATLCNTVGSTLMRLNRLPEALDEMRRGLALSERTHGARSADASRFHMNIANTHLLADAYDEARVEYEMALSIRRETLGGENPSVAHVLMNLAELHQSTGDSRAALAAYLEAARIWEASLGPRYMRLGLALAGASRASLTLGDYAAAEANARRAVDLYESEPANMPLDARHAYEALARVFLDTRRYAEALPYAERAVRISDRQPSDLEGRGDLLFLMARVLVEGRIDAAKGLTFAHDADAAYAKGGLEKARAGVALFLAREHAPRR